MLPRTVRFSDFASQGLNLGLITGEISLNRHIQNNVGQNLWNIFYNFFLIPNTIYIYLSVQRMRLFRLLISSTKISSIMLARSSIQKLPSVSKIVLRWHMHIHSLRSNSWTTNNTCMHNGSGYGEIRTKNSNYLIRLFLCQHLQLQKKRWSPHRCIMYFRTTW